MKIVNPLSVTGTKETIQTVLRVLASQNNCDGEPYDQMQIAAEYIDRLEHTIRFLEEQLDLNEIAYPTRGQCKKHNTYYEVEYLSNGKTREYCPECEEERYAPFIDFVANINQREAGNE